MSRVALIVGAALLLAAPALAETNQKQSTKSYTLTLGVGPKETMYTAAEVKATHPTSGEVMVGGMSMGGMSMGPGNRHLEVKVSAKGSSRPLHVAPKIVLTDTNGMSGMTMSEPVSAIAMYGVREGLSDWHYGDNVK